MKLFFFKNNFFIKDMENNFILLIIIIQHFKTFYHLSYKKRKAIIKERNMIEKMGIEIKVLKRK